MLNVVAMIVAAIVGLVSAVTGYGKTTQLKKGLYFGASSVAFLISMGAAYNEWRGWGWSDRSASVIRKIACKPFPKFTFYVFDLKDEESNTFAIEIRDTFAACDWGDAALVPGDGWLRQDIVGLSVVWSPKAEHEDEVKQKASFFSETLCAAGIDHKLGTHTTLDHAPVKVGIVVGKKPPLWQHLFGYGVSCS